MGNQMAVPAEANDVPAAGKDQGVKLYRFARSSTGGEWVLETANATPRFYDALEDSNQGGRKEWCLDLEGIDGFEGVKVDANLNYMLDLKARRITFQVANDIYAMRFPTEDELRKFSEKLNAYAFYNAYGFEYDDEAKRHKELGDEGEMFYNCEAAESGVAPMEVEGEADLPRDDEKLGSKAEEAKLADDDEAILGIFMGAGENDFLMRGSRFDVLRNVNGGVEDKGVSFALTPAKGGKPFTPAKVLLAKGETRMNLLTPQNGAKNVLHHADIETQKVVSTWKFEKDSVEMDMHDIVHDNKTGQLENRSTFMSLGDKTLARWDLRDARGVVQESPLVNNEIRGYSKGYNFTCMATSGDGFVAVGQRDGSISMYSSNTLQRAKTSIPGLGAPITAIDVTYDGKWVLATTDKYLMLVKTSFTDDKGKDSNGFTARMGKRGHMPRLLRLKPEDQARLGGKGFSKGKFTWVTEAGVPERWVVANIGKYTVIWSFARLRTAAADSISLGGLPTCMDYILQEKEEEVVESAFMHHKYTPMGAAGPISPLVVATPHRIFNIA